MRELLLIAVGTRDYAGHMNDLLTSEAGMGLGRRVVGERGALCNIASRG